MKEGDDMRHDHFIDDRETVELRGMTWKRYQDLMDNDRLDLTPDEIKIGWHFCPEWDSLLIGPGMPEMGACTCFDGHMKRVYM
jgi:hypothetical protein